MRSKITRMDKLMVFFFKFKFIKLRGRETDSFLSGFYGQSLRNFKHYGHLIFSKYLNTYFML